MDITPPQPPPNPTGKPMAASTAAASSNKKPRSKRTGVQTTALVATPAPQAPSGSGTSSNAGKRESVESQLMEDMNGMIATAAYYLAERRNFAPGHELDDWLEAEQQLRK